MKTPFKFLGQPLLPDLPWEWRCASGGGIVTNQTTYAKNGRPLGAIISEIKAEITEFAQTRYQILLAEMKEKVTAWKSAMPLLAIALLLAVVAFLLLTGAMVVVIAAAIGIAWALLVVGLGYLIIGALAGW